MSSHAPTLESWVLIPLGTWMSARDLSVFVLFCLGSGLAMGCTPVRAVLPTVYKMYSCKLIVNGNRPKGVISHEEESNKEA
jgi:hypothetical protein